MNYLHGKDVVHRDLKSMNVSFISYKYDACFIEIRCSWTTCLQRKLRISEKVP